MKKWLTIVVIFFLAGCARTELPEDIMSEENLATLLLDMYIAEGRLNNRSASDFLPREIYPLYHQRILEKHNISDSVYMKNMEYYLTEPMAMNRVYDIIIDSLKLRQEEIQSDTLRFKR